MKDLAKTANKILFDLKILIDTKTKIIAVPAIMQKKSLYLAAKKLINSNYFL